MVQIKIQTKINSPIEKVWKLYTTPKDITKWNNASDNWHTPKAQNDLKPGGKFIFRMESKDGTEGFDFTGEYNDVKTNELISYTMDDGRKAKITFSKEGNQTKMEITFDAENTNSIEMQRNGWQAILNNFKKYTENNQ